VLSSSGDLLLILAAAFRNLAAFPILLEAILVLVDGLKSQLGGDSIRAAMQLFFEFFAPAVVQQLAATKAGVSVVTRFMDVLNSLAKDPSSLFELLLAPMLVFSVELIQPLCAHVHELQACLFQLFHSLLLTHSKFFARAEMQQAMQRMLGAYLDSFRDTEIALFRSNIESLATLNDKCRLFQQPGFRPLLQNFLHVLMGVLLAQTHDLLRDDIVNTIYSMASVDIAWFFNNFMVAFLQSCTMLSNEQKNELHGSFAVHSAVASDHPTFSRNVCAFLNDFHFYHRINRDG
jgi:hypothetical protein